MDLQVVGMVVGMLKMEEEQIERTLGYEYYSK